MAIDEARRYELHETARRVLGAGAGDTLMELLPPVGWADVATKRDVDGLAAATKRDVDGLAAATKRDLDVLKIELQNVIFASEHRILMWMFTTVLTAVFAGTAISVAVSLTV